MDAAPLSRPLSAPGTARRIGPFAAVAGLAAFLLVFEEDPGNGTFVGAVATAVGWMVAVAVVPWRRLPAWTESFVPALGLSVTFAVLRLGCDPRAGRAPASGQPSAVSRQRAR